MQKFVSVHPIIYKVEPLGRNEYLVYERLNLLFIPAKFTYKVWLDSDPTNKVVSYKAVIYSLTEIDIHFEVKEEKGGCSVSETVNFKSYLPVKPIIKNIFKTQHKHLFDNINKL
jgi:hypothetical protein